MECLCLFLEKVFEGNSDSYAVKHSYLDEPILARYVKFHTVQWNRHPSMRVEIIGCQGKTPVATHHRYANRCKMRMAAKLYLQIYCNTCLFGALCVLPINKSLSCVFYQSINQSVGQVILLSFSRPIYVNHILSK